MSELWTQPEDSILHTFFGHRSHERIASLLPGRTVKAVRNRCHRLGLVADRRWTDEDVASLRQWYTERDGKKLELGAFAERLGRDKANVCRKARSLGLTDQQRTTGRKDRRMFKGDKEALLQHQGEVRKAWLAENEHPRGFAGHHHTPEAIKAMREKSVGRKMGFTEEQLQAMSDRTMRQAAQRPAGNVYSRTRSGKRDDLGGLFVRSSWEANYARVLNLRVSNGDIARWEYEPDRFEFPIKRGTRSYTPDFKVWLLDGTYEYHEVKGWMDPKSKTRLKRMAKYYPNETLILIGAKEYRKIRDVLALSIDEWEWPSRRSTARTKA